MFLPFMRRMKKYRVPKFLRILIAILIISGVIKIGGEVVELISKQILSADSELLNKAQLKITNLIVSVENIFGIQRVEGGNVILHYLKKSNKFSNFGSTIDFIGDTLTMTLMTIFFVILLIAESINFQKVLNQTILKRKYSSVKVFMKIESDLIKFIIVKFFISLFTGMGIALGCFIFGIDFPVLWGLIAFLLNFIQMVGSVVSVVVTALFALVELDATGTWFLFVLFLTGVQVLFGSIVEPIFMGKSFSINVVTILIMLMFWGFLWGVPGLIMAVPITVFLKIIFEQYSNTRVIASLMAGPEQQIMIPRKIKTKIGSHD
ncbi:MAG: AI-2E family transporter [Bacteroidetes bacterium]|nr:MAG: AI-2E family transporter [Bacteroidota bacterium]